MRRFTLASFILLLLSSVALVGFTQDPQVSRKQLREMLTQLGYEVKDLETEPGKEKYSIKVSRDGLDIPIGCELSGNSAYLWLTVNLGEAHPEISNKNYLLLKENANIQPSQFYVSKSGLLMCGLPIENRGITNVHLRSRIDSLAGSVAKTEDVWKK